MKERSRESFMALLKLWGNHETHQGLPPDIQEAVDGVYSALYEARIPMTATVSDVHCAIKGCTDEHGPWVPCGDFSLCEDHYCEIVIPRTPGQTRADVPTGGNT
jgi:hypothetical protein